MKTARLDLPVMASWMESNGRRLDCNPYLSGAFEARVLLERLNAKKQPLKDVTQGGLKGIFNGPRFARCHVGSKLHGVPLLSGGEMLQADISNAPLISKKQVATMPHMVLVEGTTLISSYGTIGRTAYCRADMAGMVGSDNVLKIIPDVNEINSGYLYAFLSSKFGVPLITSGLSGSVVTFLDPSRVADLPVPRLGDEIEGRVHDLIVEAARLRTLSSEHLTDAVQELESLADLHPLARTFENHTPDVSIASSENLSSRMDALFHSNYHKSALLPLLELPETKRTTIGKIASNIFEPTRFKRVQLDNSTYGFPFFGTTALMWLDPIPSYYIPRKGGESDEYIVDEKTVLIPRSGQLSGIIGQAVLPHGSLIGGAISEHAIRVVAKSPIIAGYIFLALSSEYGRRQLKARAYGKSIPTLDVNMIQQVVIPKLSDREIDRLGTIGWQISKDRSLAIKKEQEAKNTLEQFINAGN